jgi:hypothetical protein
MEKVQKPVILYNLVYITKYKIKPENDAKYMGCLDVEY